LGRREILVGPPPPRILEENKEKAGEICNGYRG
jgi:hypothetical protein